MPDQIFVEPGATEAEVIQVSGVCYRRVGPSETPYDTAEGDIQREYNNCADCSEGPAPASCPSGLSTCYAIEHYGYLLDSTCPHL